MADFPYSPRLRTAVMLCGAGTAGAYQSGVLRALAEAGVKIDVLTAHGAGAVLAACAAIDGGSRFWDARGPWSDPRLRRAYRWRQALRVAGFGLAAALIALLSPLLVLVYAAIAYALSLLVALVNLPGVSAWLVEQYHASLAVLFQPPVIPTIVPRAIVLALLVVLGVLIVAALPAMGPERSRRQWRGSWWWRLVGAPLDAREPGGTLIETMWGLVRGASNQPRPSPAEISRRYIEILSENLGQPGFRELLIGVHDLDARRDLVGAVLGPDARAGFAVRRSGTGPREAEVVDFAGAADRDLVVDFLAGALRLPAASAPHVVRFPVESYWRGEPHRLCDRPELAARLLDEIARVGVEQVILVSPAAPAVGPHAMRAPVADLRGRMGEVTRSVETAALADAWASAAARFSGVFTIRPDHNPLGPFDFAGAYDEASDRHRTVAELIQQGFDDAYRQFIEPVVAAGDKVSDEM